MEDPAALDQLLVQVLHRQVGVRPRLAVKAEIPVAPGQGLHDGQGGVYVGIIPQALQADARFLRDPGQLTAKAVPAHFAHKGTALAQLAQHGQHVAGRAAGVCLKQGVALLRKPVLGEIDQQLSQSHHIQCLVLHCPSSLFRLQRMAVPPGRSLGGGFSASL